MEPLREPGKVAVSLLSSHAAFDEMAKSPTDCLEPFGTPGLHASLEPCRTLGGVNIKADALRSSVCRLPGGVVVPPEWGVLESMKFPAGLFRERPRSLSRSVFTVMGARLCSASFEGSAPLSEPSKVDSRLIADTAFDAMRGRAHSTN